MTGKSSSIDGHGHHKIIHDVNDFEAGPFKVVPVTYNEDNYGYLIVDTEKDTIVAVDPGDPTTITSTISKISKTATLSCILTTHHHWDHSGGNAVLKSKYPNVVIVGSTTDFPKWGLRSWWQKVNKRVDDGDVVEIGRMIFKAIKTPCHTHGSLIYYFDIEASITKHNIPRPTLPTQSSSNSHTHKREPAIAEPWSGPGTPVDTDIENENENAAESLANWNPMMSEEEKVPGCLFTGDTLFVGGAGRFFEGTAKDMHMNVQKMASLIPGNTLIWPGHEYAFGNLTFAKALEPSNIFVQDDRFINAASIPTTFHSEIQHNPFLRIDSRSRNGELWANIIDRVEEQLQQQKKKDNKMDVEVDVDVAIAKDVRNGRKFGAEVYRDAEVQVLGALRWLKDGFKG
ncbi:hypothetical protein HDU76_002623 [Blyttiomyces sp. JEL0837]|nr:hypothetical protein HDU76_002623 [Blyttiomyces sp. JEL0837]